jgi:hypothetical protein
LSFAPSYGGGFREPPLSKLALRAALFADDRTRWPKSQVDEMSLASSDFVFSTEGPRLEHVVVVTHDGCDLLSQFSLTF